MSNRVLIVDFGSQVTQLIARRVREAGFYSEIIPYNADAAQFDDFGAAADVIFRPCDDDEGCPLDPHLYLDDAFCEDSELDRYETDAAEREAWQRVLNLDDEEFTTHMSSFYRPPVAADATRWDDEPLEIEI